MKASFVTFADFGKKQNRKTETLLPVVELFKTKGILHFVICRISKDTSFMKGSVPLWLHYGLKVLEKIFPSLVVWVRAMENRLIDARAQKEVLDSDIVLFHPELYFPHTLLAAKKQNIPTVGIATMAHPNYSAQVEQEEYKKLNLSKKYYYYTELKDKSDYLSQYDYIIANSQFVKETYIEAGFKKGHIYVAENSITLPQTKEERKDDEVFRVLYVAHTNPLKGLQYLLEAWKLVKVKNKELIIVGDFRYVPKKLRHVFNEIIKHDLTIKTLGNKSRSEIPYNQSDVFICSSLTEGHPRVVLEALSMGIPVITTEAAQSRVVDGMHGYVIPSRNSILLAEKITYLGNNQEIRLSMREKITQITDLETSFSDGIYKAVNEILSSHTQ